MLHNLALIHQSSPKSTYLHLRAFNPFPLWRASLVVETVEKLPAMQETQVRSLGQEDPLEKGMATYSSILPGEFHGQRRLAGYSPWDRKDWTWLSDQYFHFPFPSLEDLSLFRLLIYPAIFQSLIGNIFPLFSASETFAIYYSICIYIISGIALVSLTIPHMP